MRSLEVVSNHFEHPKLEAFAGEDERVCLVVSGWVEGARNISFSGASLFSEWISTTSVALDFVRNGQTLLNQVSTSSNFTNTSLWAVAKVNLPRQTIPARPVALTPRSR